MKHYRFIITDPSGEYHNEIIDNHGVANHLRWLARKMEEKSNDYTVCLQAIDESSSEPISFELKPVSQ